MPDRARRIADSEEFYYSKAIDAWNCWINLAIPADLLTQLISMKYEDFVSATDPQIEEIRTALFRVVSYCDDHARDKEFLNEYPDHRVIARAGIRQNHWCSQLLKYKESSTSSLSDGIKNIIDFIEDPQNNWPIVSENHRAWISSHILKEEYNKETFNQRLKDALSSQWDGVNAQNTTTFLATLLYANDREWKNPEIQGIFMHDPTNWQDSLISDMGNEKGVVWWHALPSSKYRKEILEQLAKRIESNQTFPVYYLVQNQALYKAEVEDFATKDNYSKKADAWKQFNPAWFNESFEDYVDDTHSAAIAFLISRMEKIKPGIHVGRFKTFKNMKDKVIGGMTAFTDIFSESEIMSNRKMEEYIQHLKVNKNIVLTGAPGTGKTYLAKKIAERMSANYEVVQFHPSYDYTDFVEGIRPEMKDGMVGFRYEMGIFKKFCGSALANPNKDYVFIIDEINRGELAKIFGELFSAIDPGYRGATGMVKTQYQNLIGADNVFSQGFYVPQNVFIIGTMNDIDRGVETIDFAIRRRFAWIPISVDDRKEMLDDLGDLRDEAEKRMNNLNAAIKENPNLSEEYQIGGAYFLKLKEQQLGFDGLWDFYLKPLLNEYLRGVEDITGQMAILEKAYKMVENHTDDADDRQ